METEIEEIAEFDIPLLPSLDSPVNIQAEEPGEEEEGEVGVERECDNQNYSEIMAEVHDDARGGASSDSDVSDVREGLRKDLSRCRGYEPPRKKGKFDEDSLVDESDQDDYDG